jgi:hypothetical protein
MGISPAVPMNPGREHKAEKSVSSFLSKSGVPGLSLFVGSGVNHLLKLVKLQEWYIKRKLRETWPSNPELLDLLTSWVRYVLKPTRDRDDEFVRTLRRLADSGHLFDLFCFILQQANYTTLVLLFDELDSVALNELKPFWDPPRREESYYNELNLVMFLSAHKSAWGAANSDPALKRRFCNTPNGHCYLSGPQIGLSENEDDDFKYIVNKVRQLLKDAPQLKRPDSDKVKVEDELKLLSAKLENASNLTWHTLWSQVIRVLTTLQRDA